MLSPRVTSRKAASLAYRNGLAKPSVVLWPAAASAALIDESMPATIGHAAEVPLSVASAPLITTLISSSYAETSGTARCDGSIRAGRRPAVAMYDAIAPFCHAAALLRADAAKPPVESESPCSAPLRISPL